MVREGKTREAIAEFESALDANPRLVMAHIDLIALYGKLGQRDKAEQHFREAVTLDAGWAEAHYNWGLLLLGEHKSAEATEAFRNAIAVNPHYADAHIQIGSMLDETGRSSEAQKHFRRALDDRPGDREAQFLLGRSLIRTGQFPEAIAQLLETIKVDDDKTPVCLQTLGVAYQRAGDLKESMKYLEQARQRALARKMLQLAAELQQQINLVAMKDSQGR
jgi:Tfp pilus assembly protein PilF